MDSIPTVFILYHAIIYKIKQILQLDWNASIHNVNKQANFCADWLAKHGASSLAPLHVWDSSPPALSSLILVDATAVLYLTQIFFIYCFFSFLFVCFLQIKKYSFYSIKYKKQIINLIHKALLSIK